MPHQESHQDGKELGLVSRLSRSENARALGTRLSHPRPRSEFKYRPYQMTTVIQKKTTVTYPHTYIHFYKSPHFLLIFINPRSRGTIQDTKTDSDKIEKGAKKKIKLIN